MVASAPFYSRASLVKRPYRLVLLVIIVAATLPVAVPAQAASEVVVIEPVSVRGDLVSGGDVLVRLTAPDGASVEDLELSVDGGQLVVSAFGTEAEGTGLALGSRGTDSGST